MVNGVCEVSKTKDALISNTIVPILFISFGLSYILYRKFKTVYFLISLLSFLFLILIVLSGLSSYLKNLF